MRARVRPPHEKLETPAWSLSRAEQHLGVPVQRSLDEQQANTPNEAGAGTLATAILESSPGRPLDPAATQFLEPRLGYSFEHVRIHADADADRLSHAVDAEAFTTGPDIFFRSGAYAPSSSEGLRLLAHEAMHTLQQAAGPVDGTRTGDVALSDPGDRFEQAAEQAAESAMAGEHAKARPQSLEPAIGHTGSVGTANGSHTPTLAPVIQRKVVDIGSEKVDVANDDEQKEAQQIIDDIKKNYGIDVSSMTSVTAIKKDYSSTPEGVRKGLQAQTWQMKELRALAKALAHFAPILGKNREKSSREFDDQEVTSVGRVKQGIDEDTASGQLDTTTLGEFFKSSKNFTMFDALSGASHNFPGDNAKQIEGTAVHEIAHGLLHYALPDYIAGLDYWTSESVKSGKAGAEAPITPYGATNANEDFSEAAKFFFVEPDTLKAGKGQPAGTPGNPCPKRFELLTKFVKDWQKQPKGDFVEPKKGDTAAA